MIYKKGYLTWEWHPKVSLRSSLHPLFYASAIWFFKLIKLDYNIIINFIPNVLNAILFAIADDCYFFFLKKVFCFNNIGDFIFFFNFYYIFNILYFKKFF